MDLLVIDIDFNIAIENIMVHECKSIIFILVCLTILTQRLSYFPRNAVLCSTEG